MAISYKYNVLRCNPETHEVELYNIFDNVVVNETAHAIAEAYADHKLTFSEVCKKLDRIIEVEMWGNQQYSMRAGTLSGTNLTTWGCYEQAHANIATIAHMIIEAVFYDMYELGNEERISS